MSTRGSKPGERRGGRQKGTPNKINAELKDMILGALDDAGGQKYLLAQAHENPNAFLTLVGKTLPKQVNADMKLSGTVNFSTMSDADLQAEIARLNEQLHSIK